MAAAFAISPAIDLIDVSRRIVLTGLTAGAEVTIAAETPRDGHLCAQAVFAAGADGQHRPRTRCALARRLRGRRGDGAGLGADW